MKRPSSTFFSFYRHYSGCAYALACWSSDLSFACLGALASRTRDAPFGGRSFRSTTSSPRGFWGLNGKSRLKSGEGGLCSTLLLKPLQEGFSKVEVRLFGLPLRRLKVDVLKLPAVHVGGHAIGVLLSEEGVVVVGHIPLKDIDGRERYPAKEAGIKAGDIILSINGGNRPPPPNWRIWSKRAARAAAPTPDPAGEDRAPGLPFPGTPVGCWTETQLSNGDLCRGSGGWGRSPDLLFTYPPFWGFGPPDHGFWPAFTARGRGGRIVLAASLACARASGEPGKMGIFTSNDDIIREIHHNTAYGVFGRLRREPTGNYLTEPIQVALVSEVKTGPAEILTVLAGERIERFAVKSTGLFPVGR